ncbi:MAG: hypothetical protein K2U26_10265, partial [Cyclobacteriaceae bacterium]|nr:hypothetical protein [Cyclobacteriaceae bacterium]
MNTIRKIHFTSGIILSIFIGAHLFNHLFSVIGATEHIEMMNLLRHVYRNIFVETILLLAVLTQIISGLNLFALHRKAAISGFDKLHIWTGLYLAIFFTIHVGA